MATIVTDAYTHIANALEQVIAAEFDNEPHLVIHHDRIHESLGSDGHLHVGISPTQEDPGASGVLTTEAIIQFYGPFKPDVDPFQSADPRLITNKAERLRRALEHVRIQGTQQVWFLTVGRTTYPEDATGNKTRFELEVSGTGNNSGLVETFG